MKTTTAAAAAADTASSNRWTDLIGQRTAAETCKHAVSIMKEQTA